jgi:hypothetical protein
LALPIAAEQYPLARLLYPEAILFLPLAELSLHSKQLSTPNCPYNETEDCRQIPNKINNNIFIVFRF